MIADLLAIAGFAVAASGWAATACHAARLRYLLHTDPLTGLANRDALATRLRRHNRRGATVGLLLADLDGFKQVNDLHGHDVGNTLLQDISRRMRAVAHPSELVVRLHGDEFAILLGNLPNGTAGTRSAAQRRDVFAAAVDTPMRTRQDEVRVSASIGVAVLPASGADLSALLSTADQDMYCVKRSRAAHDGSLMVAAA